MLQTTKPKNLEMVVVFSHFLIELLVGSFAFRLFSLGVKVAHLVA